MTGLTYDIVTHVAVCAEKFAQIKLFCPLLAASNRMQSGGKQTGD